MHFATVGVQRGVRGAFVLSPICRDQKEQQAHDESRSMSCCVAVAFCPRHDCPFLESSDLPKSANVVAMLVVLCKGHCYYTEVPKPIQTDWMIRFKEATTTRVACQFYGYLFDLTFIVQGKEKEVYLVFVPGETAAIGSEAGGIENGSIEAGRFPIHKPVAPSKDYNENERSDEESLDVDA